jgi:hypothetical protein
MTLATAIGANVSARVIEALRIAALGATLFFNHEAAEATGHLWALEALPTGKVCVLERTASGLHIDG